MLCWFYIGKTNENRMLPCHDTSWHNIVKKSVNISLGKCVKMHFGIFFANFMVRSNTAGGENRARVKRGKQKMTKSLKYDRKIRHFWKCCSHAAWERDFFLILAGDFSVKVDFWNTSRARMRFFIKMHDVNLMKIMILTHQKCVSRSDVCKKWKIIKF